jgi:hypothetical protein
MATNQPRARAIIEATVESQAAALPEASVRRPPRSKNYIAIFTGPEPGQQVAQSTGLTDKVAAMARAQKWERQARRARLARKQDRVTPVSGKQAHGLTQGEVAVLLNVSERAVRAIEKRAIRKLQRHPVLKRIWQEFNESLPSTVAATAMTPERISASEASALLGLATTPFELRVLRKVLEIARQAAPRP